MGPRGPAPAGLRGQAGGLYPPLKDKGLIYT